MSFLRRQHTARMPAANSLASAPRGRVVAALGASNLGGFDDTGFADDATVVAFPGDFTLCINSTTPETEWPDPHGPVVGFVQALTAAGYSAAGLTWVQAHREGSALVDWYGAGAGTNLGADLISYCSTLGVVPGLILAIVPSADTATAGAAAQIERKLRLGLDPMLSAWTGAAGPPGVILAGPNKEDDTGYAVGLAAAQRYAAQLTGRNVHVSMVGLTRQPEDSDHLSRAGQLAFGGRLWAPVAAARALTLEAA